MTASSDDESRGFFAYYRKYAHSGIHTASAALLTAFGLIATYTGNNVFILLAIAVYVLPLIFLYLTGEGENVPSVVEDDTGDADEHESSDADAVETGRRDDADATTASDVEIGSDTDTGRTDAADDTEPESTADSAVTGISDDESDSETEPGWTATDTPTDQSLLDVVATRDGACAVGDGGIVLGRRAADWEIALEHGPTAESNTLRGVDTTEDGGAVWFAGDSGVLGRSEDGRLTDHSAPKDQTSTWADVAVTGDTGEERIHLVNGSGELLRGEYDGGAVEWGDIETPGSGSSISSIEFLDSDRGHICDTNQYVFETTDGGDNYETIGIEDANAAFTGVAATDSTVVVAGDDGSVFRYDGAVWTRLHAGSALSAIDLVDETGLAVGDGGAIYELTDGNWESVETPSDADLYGVVIGSDDSEQVGPDVAVGTDGTVIERRQ